MMGFSCLILVASNYSVLVGIGGSILVEANNSVLVKVDLLISIVVNSIIQMEVCHLNLVTCSDSILVGARQATIWSRLLPAL